MSHNDFVDWWLETDYGRKSKLKWDSNRHTEIWNSYHQVAQGIDGAPKVMCKRCGKILEHPYTLSPNSTGKAQYHGTSTIQKHRKTAGFTVGKGEESGDYKLPTTRGRSFSKHTLLTRRLGGGSPPILTLNRLPFHLIEHPSFKRIINKARSAPSPPVIPSADTIRRRLGSLVKDRQQRILRTLPSGSKISIALDCWTSPFSQAFMAITGYFMTVIGYIVSYQRLDVTHYVFKIYNKLFDHLERSQAQLRRKRPWKKQMLEALEAGRSKLDEYYSQADDLRGNIYAISTMLAPVNKFKFFLSSDWDQKWRDTYRLAFEQALVPYQAQVRISSRDLQSSLTIAHPSSRLEEMLDGRIYNHEPLLMKSVNILTAARFPAIAALARDTLSFPATGAGVERLFNTARDICHYRRGRMKSETVEALMMFLCTTKFDMEEQEATLLEKFFSQDELEAAKEEREEKLSEIEVDPISDTEEQEDELEDKPGDAIEVVIEDRPEDIPEERPLPTNTSIREKT
ncbi:hypothetical protein PDIDSM_5318 [Penicillium digitatum]|nr:hypothetical protein PDIDSM_5318 [Penicillium digitatum]